MSLRWDRLVRSNGWRKWSVSCEIFSVGDSFAEMMGRPGGGRVFLCILGSRYSWEVLGFGLVR